MVPRIPECPVLGWSVPRPNGGWSDRTKKKPEGTGGTDHRFSRSVGEGLQPAEFHEKPGVAGETACPTWPELVGQAVPPAFSPLSGLAKPRWGQMTDDQNRSSAPPPTDYLTMIARWSNNSPVCRHRFNKAVRTPIWANTNCRSAVASCCEALIRSSCWFMPSWNLWYWAS